MLDSVMYTERETYDGHRDLPQGFLGIQLVHLEIPHVSMLDSAVGAPQAQPVSIWTD
jgi:hypothetical protein